MFASSILRIVGSLLIVVLAMPAQQKASDADGFLWQQMADSVALSRGNHEIWKFRYGESEAKAAFHPLALPDGPVVTCYRNEDHPWHRGMWFSWKFINGLNYWEENEAGISEGRTEVIDTKVELHFDFSARISLAITYGPPHAEPVLRETRTIEISAPDAKGTYHLDWAMTFEAQDNDVLLDRTPIPGEPNGKSYGGYAGLAVRLAKEMSDIRVSTVEGTVTFANGNYRGRAMAADYAGIVDDRMVGIAFLDHPNNLNSPSPWWIIDNPRGMKYFNPSVLGFSPHTLKAKQTLTLRYRAIVHFDSWDAKRLRIEIDRYIKGKK